MKTLASNIKKAILFSGMTQREVAEKVGITEVSMSRYVLGTRIPKAPTLARIATVLGCTPNDLLNVMESDVTEDDVMLLKGLRDTIECLFRSDRFSRSLNIAIRELEKKV